VLAAQPFPSLLCGDASLSRRPMRRIAEPLRAMGASIECLGAGERPPLRIAPPRTGGLLGVAHMLAVDSAQVRGAILLAGVHAAGPTRIHPAGVARDHTERMLRALGVCIRSNSGGLELFPTQPSGWGAGEFAVPGDPSAAAFFAAAAAGTAGSVLRVERVGLNPGRIRCFEILRGAGSAVRVQPRGESMGEPWGEVEIRGRLVRPLRLAGDDVVQCIDEIPALLVAAALAGVGAELIDAGELRVKESDRLAVMAEGLARLGVEHELLPDGMWIRGGSGFSGGVIESHGDHRIAMAFAMASVRAAGPLEIRDVANVATSFPGFVQTARSAGLQIDAA
jgi:3-phosphoshikimate 1-carboxyvinyltransferase